MATSGVVTLEYTVVELIEEAYERAGYDLQMLNAQHMRTARRSMNLMFSAWANSGVRLWKIDNQTQTVTASTNSYTLPAGTIDVLEAVLTRSSVSTPMHRISRAEYQYIPDKTQEGRPDRFWVDRQISQPVMYVWQTPENSTDVIDYWRMVRQDDVTKGTETADIPQRWWEAMCAGLAYQLWAKLPLEKRIPKDRAQLLSDAGKAFNDALYEDRDRGPTTVAPVHGGYFR